jgi:hypothetical protein
VSSIPDDRTTRAVIRDEALRLFAERGLAWPAAFAAAGLVIFRARTRTRTHHDRWAAGLISARRHAVRKHAPG